MKLRMGVAANKVLSNFSAQNAHNILPYNSMISSHSMSTRSRKYITNSSQR